MEVKYKDKYWQSTVQLQVDYSERQKYSKFETPNFAWGNFDYLPASLHD